MCGINGFTFSGASIDPEKILDLMNSRIDYRGPDDEGTFITDFAAIGMRRLSIIDLSTGHQPIFNEDETLSIVFNGEIYNYRELKKELEQKGHKFKTSSDTEVILHLYEERGEDLVSYLNGMFAFAILDMKDKSILFARDHFGIKPFYYHITGGQDIIFSSEIGSLVSHPSLPRRVDYQAMIAYLTTGYVPDPLTIFKDVFQLAPGHMMVWRKGRGVNIKRYWSFEIRPDETIDEKSAVVELRELLLDSVKRQMISDVPLGTFLSGGIDSSTVTAFASMVSSKPVKTFSVKFNDAEYDESKYARMVANHLGTDHHEIDVPLGGFDPEILDIIISHVGQPFGDTSCIPTYLVSKYAKEHVKVCLSGDGGDELFYGYEHTKWTGQVIRAKRNIPAFIRSTAAKLLDGLKRAPIVNNSDYLRRIRKGLYLSLHDEQNILLRLRCIYQPEEIRSLIIPAVYNEIKFQAKDAYFVNMPELNGLLPEELAMVLLVNTSLPGDILRKVDRMSMAPSLEVRVPILDYRIGEFAGKLPMTLKKRNGVGKYLLREAGRPYLPDEIYSHKKQGFAIPLYKWFNDDFWDMMEDYLGASSNNPVKNILVESKLRQIIDQGKNAGLEEGVMSHFKAATRAWNILLLARWAEMFNVDFE